MTPAPRATSVADRRLGLAGAFLLLVVALATRAIGWVPSVVNPDESIFSLAAREVVAGHLPYLTLFDNKPVGSTLILASVFWPLGVSVLVARLVGLVFAWASGLLVAALLRAGGFARREALIAGIVQIAYVSAAGLGGQATLTELLLTPFTILAVLLLMRLVPAAPRTHAALALAAGLVCGLAVLTKIVPILPGLALAGTVLGLAVLRARLRAGAAVLLLALFAAGAALPMVLTALIYAGAGAFDAFWWSNFGFAGAYAGIHPKAATVAQRLGTTVDVIWPLLALAAVAIVDAALVWRRERQVGDLLIVALVWAGAEIVAAAASLQFYPHYFLSAVAPLVVLAAFGLRALARWIGAPGSAGGTASGAVLVLGVVAALIALERSQVDMLRERLVPPDVPRQIARAIGQASRGRTPTIFVTNYQLSGVYLLTGAPLPPTRYAVPAHLFSRQSRMIRADPKAEVARVLAGRPEFIVLDDAEPLPVWARAMFNGVADDYRLLRQIGDVRVLQRS